MPYIRGTDRNQVTMLPEIIDDYVSSDSQVRVIDAYVEQVDVVAHNFSFAICPKVGVQAAVDSKHKLIIDFEVITQPNDLGCLSPLALQVKHFLECETIDMLADKGYYHVDCLKACLENGIRPYVSKQSYANRTGNKKYYADQFKYKQRQMIVEHPFGTIKHIWPITLSERLTF